MSRQLHSSWVFGGLLIPGILLAGFGCSSYHYMREISPELQTSRMDYVVNNPGNRYNDDIQAGRVRKGMSRLQVRVTWGEPDQVTARVPGSNETWSYQETEPSRGTSVYNLRFVSGLLSTVDVDHGGAELPATVDTPAALQGSDTAPTTTPPATGKRPGDWQ